MSTGPIVGDIVGDIVDRFIVHPITRAILTWNGTSSFGVLSKPIVFPGDFKVKFKVSSSNLSKDMRLIGGSKFLANGLEGETLIVIDNPNGIEFIVGNADTTFTRHNFGGQASIVNSTLNEIEFERIGSSLSCKLNSSALGSSVAESRTITLSDLIGGEGTAFFEGSMLDLEFIKDHTGTPTVTKFALNANTNVTDIELPTNNTFGSEEVINGTFDTDTGWTKGDGWGISGGVATCDGTQSAFTKIEQPITGSLIAGRIYEFKYNVISLTAGLIRFNVDSSAQSEDVDSASLGLRTGVFTASGLGTDFELIGNSLFTGSVDNFSVREVDNAITYTDVASELMTLNKETGDLEGVEKVVNPSFNSDTAWSKGTGVTISGGQADSDGSIAAFATVLGQSILTVGQTFKYSYKLPSVTSGGIQLKLGSNGQMIETSAGVFTGIDVAEGDVSLSLSSGATPYNGSVDDVSVKRIIQSQ